jgi:hypothetical protein
MPLRYPFGGVLLLAFLQLSFYTGAGQVVAGIAANGRPIPKGDTVNVCQGNPIFFQSVGQGSLNITWRFQLGSGANTGSRR